MSAAPHTELARRAEQAADVLPPLLAMAERVATTVFLGVHGRRRVGRGETFWQYRRYQSGDPASLIDWRKSARSRRLFVRETEWEAAQTVWLWADASPSMEFASDPNLERKRYRGAVLLLALAMLLVRAGEKVAVLGDRRNFNRRGSMEDLARALFPTDPKEGANLPPVVSLPRDARVVLVSDFLSPMESIDATLRALAAARIGGFLIKVHDPAEETFPYEGRVDFQGLEGEPIHRLGRAQSVAEDYRIAYQGHRDGIGDMARRLGWTLLEHGTDVPPEQTLLAVFEALAGPRAWRG